MPDPGVLPEHFTARSLQKATRASSSSPGAPASAVLTTLVRWQQLSEQGGPCSRGPREPGGQTEGGGEMHGALLHTSCVFSPANTYLIHCSQTLANIRAFSFSAESKLKSCARKATAVMRSQMGTAATSFLGAQCHPSPGAGLCRPPQAPPRVSASGTAG